MLEEKRIPLPGGKVIKVTQGAFNALSGIGQVFTEEHNWVDVSYVRMPHKGSISLRSKVLTPEDITGHNDVIKIGDTVVVLTDIEKYRYVVYDKVIQHVRNPEGFIDYHKSNPGRMKDMLSNMWYAMNFRKLGVVENMYNDCTSNGIHQRAKYSATNNYSGPVQVDIPISELLPFSYRWLQGIVIETYGANGFKLIEEAKNEAKRKFVGEPQQAAVEPDVGEYVDAVGLEINKLKNQAGKRAIMNQIQTMMKGLDKVLDQKGDTTSGATTIAPQIWHPDIGDMLRTSMAEKLDKEMLKYIDKK